MSPLLHWLTSPEWTHVVGALLHSLWQGAILAVALALVLRRLTNPVTRYRCALGALGLLLIANLITWAVLNAPQPSAPVASPVPTLEKFAAPIPPPPNPNATDKIIAFVELPQPQAKINWTAWIALAWMFGALIMLGRASIKVAGAEKLRRSCQPLNDEPIALLVAEACRAVKLTRKIRVAVTDKLTSPAVVGVLVPTLILPLSLFTTLTPTQIQFVLLHELAHIRRGDYLANLFQLFAEALWFFNPAVWWISHQIRREREACCDALAIELSGAPADYARTLVHVAENILHPAPDAAPAFGDDGHEPSSLADRVQRLLIPGYRPTLRLTWRAMLAALFVGSGLLFLSAVGTRVTVAAILSPRERIERIEKKMVEYGENLSPETSDETPAAPQVEISGRVTTADGSPLPPKLKWVNIYYSRKNYSGADSARLETNGFFRTKIHSGGKVAAALSEPGFATVIAGPVVVDGANAVTNLDLVLERGFAVPIFVTDAETGKPIHGAMVKAQFWVPNMGVGLGSGWELRTDATGITTLTNCSASVELKLSINAAGYEIADERTTKLKAGDPIQIPLKRGQALSGVVLDKTTALRLANATVRMIYQAGGEGGRHQWTDNSRLLATTDANGRFTVTQLRRGAKYWLGVSAPGHESQLFGPVTAGTSEVNLRLGPELIVRGRVIGDMEGLQIINKDYCLSRNYSEAFDNYSHGFQEWIPLKITDGVATFQFTNPIPGLVKLSGRQGFHEEREITAPVDDWLVDLSKTRPMETDNRPKREVVFRFTHASGVAPRGLVSVTIPDSLDPKRLTAHSQKCEITNSEVRVLIAIGGRTSIEPERMVGYWFDRAGKNGSLLSLEVTNGAGPMVVNIPLVAAGAIYAKARNADGSPAGGLFFGVQEIRRAPSRSDHGSLGSSNDSTSDDAPRKWVSGPLPLGGTYQVYGWRGNSLCVSKPITLTEEKPDAEVELQFAAGQTFTGLVLDPEGQPLRNIELEANFSLANGHGFGLRPVLTDERGEFRIANAMPELGQYSVTLSAPGLMAEKVDLNFKNRPQTIRLKRGLKLGGRVIEAETGHVIPNIEVRAADLSSYKLPMVKTQTDAEGWFEFTALGEAEYKFFVEDGQELNNQKFRADGNTNITLKVKLYEWSKAKPKPANAQANIQNGSTNLIAKGDFVIITFSGVAEPPRPHEEQVKPDGSILVPMIGRVVAIGKSVGQLQQEIHDAYVPTFYKRLSIAVTISPTMVLAGTLPLPIYRLKEGATTLEHTPTLGDLPNGPGTLFTSESRNTRMFYSGDDPLDLSKWRRKTARQGDAPRGMADWTLDDAQEQVQPHQQWFWYRTRDGAQVTQVPTTNAPPTEPLFTRGFDLSPSTLYAKILTNLTSAEINRTASSNLAPMALEGFRTWMKSLGVNMDPKQGKMLFYSNGKGHLLARATLAELDAIETAIANLNEPAVALDTRTFGAVPAKIVEAIETHAPQFKPVTRTNVAAGLRVLLESSGADLSRPKSMLYNDRAGELFVRATKADLDAIEKFLTALNHQPPQVNLKVYWVEMSKEFNLFTWAATATNSLTSLSNRLPVMTEALFPTPPNALPLPIFRIRNIAGALTPQQMAMVQQRIKTGDGLTLLNEGQVSTASERQARLQTVEVKTIISSLNPAALTRPGVSATNLLTGITTSLGPTVDIWPSVTPGHTNISLQVATTLTEFLGYEPVKEKVTVYVDGKKKRSAIPQPRFRVQQMTNNWTLADGQTLILGQPVVTEMTKASDGKFTSTDVATTKTNFPAVLITATIIDSTGQPVHQP